MPDHAPTPAVDRKALITQIEALTAARLVCYATSDRGGQETQIGDDVIPIAYEHLRTIGATGRLALLIYSRGGHTMTGFALANACRDFATQFDVLVPFRAHSCATLISLGANQVLMGPFGQLSPIDPSITTPHGPVLTEGQQTKFIPVSVEDVAGYFALAQKEAKISDAGMGEVLAHLCGRVNPLALGAVYRAREQIGMLAKKLLRRHLTDEARIDRIVTILTRELLSHDYVIGRTEAHGLELPIVDPSEELADAMWRLYKDFADEMKLAQPWNVEVEIGTQQVQRRSNTRAIIESRSLKHTFVTTHELRRTTVTKDGVKFDAVQGKILGEGWSQA